MLAGLPLEPLGWVAIALVGVGIAGAVLSQLGESPRSGVRPALARYVTHISRDAAFLRLPITGERIAVVQGVVSVALVVLATILENPAPAFVVPLVIGVPVALLRRARDTRVQQIEEQLDSWLTGLANTLRATPALADAMSYSSRIMGGALAEEVDVMLKERTLGVTLDDALRRSAERIGSRTVTAVFASLVLARTTGGNLPHLLETSAAQLREMARLDGVVRTKTAEGRVQAWVLALMPFGLMSAIQAIDHDFFVPLTLNVIGMVIIAGAVFLWLIAIGISIKILQVDL